jgi:hypothetical protein
MNIVNLVVFILIITASLNTWAACTINAAYTPYYTKPIIDHFLDDFHTSIQEKTGCNLTVTTNKDDNAYLSRLLNNDYTLSIIPYNLLDDVKVVGANILRKYTDPKNGLRTIIIANKEASQQLTIDDLKDQLILTPGRYSSSYEFLKQSLEAAGIFNKDNIDVDTPHELIITKILSHEVKFGSTSTLTFSMLSKELQSKFTIIKQSEPLINFLITPSSTPKESTKAIIDSVRHIKVHPWVEP